MGIATQTTMVKVNLSQNNLLRSRQVYIELVVEALLILFLSEERADTYRHKET
jgi:hypothetical protein